MKRNELPSQERLHELFDYSVVTGNLYWRESRNNQATGSKVKNSWDKGYKRVSVDGVRYKQHRIIWKWITGEDPGQELDHINCDKGNNAWHNLRAATRQQNNRNVASQGATPFKGVSYYPRYEKYMAQITVNGIQRTLGYFDTPEEAHQNYCAVASVLHGDFAHF